MELVKPAAMMIGVRFNWLTVAVNERVGDCRPNR